jgi:hypothetical protein
MSWDAIAAVAELAGAVGVIASLGYLALQIRHSSNLLEQNTKSVRTNAAVISGNHGADFTTTIAMNPEVARLWRTGAARPHELTDEEQFRFDQLLSGFIIRMDVNYALFRGGTLEEDVHDIWERQLGNWLGHPRFLYLYETGYIESLTSRPYFERIEARLAEYRAASGNGAA